MLKLIVPVGLVPPLKVAVSWIVPPAVAVGVAEVVTVGEALITVLVSPAALHAAVKLLLARPGPLPRPFSAPRARAGSAVAGAWGAAPAGGRPAAARIIRPVDAEAVRPRREGPAAERRGVLDRPPGGLGRCGSGRHRGRSLVDDTRLTRIVARSGEAVVVGVARVAGGAAGRYWEVIWLGARAVH